MEAAISAAAAATTSLASNACEAACAAPSPAAEIRSVSLARKESGAPSRKDFPARARELAADDPALASVAGWLLSVSRA